MSRKIGVLNTGLKCVCLLLGALAVPTEVLSMESPKESIKIMRPPVDVGKSGSSVPSLDKSNENLGGEEIYKACSLGYYTGKRPGRLSYVKDAYVWVVTPQFAKSYCMPAEFVSNELKGAEAVAYKLEPRLDAVNCRVTKGREDCPVWWDHKFEVYIKSGSVPKMAEGRYQQYPVLPSMRLIGLKPVVVDLQQKWHAKDPVGGAAALFSSNQFSLRAVGESNDAWSMGSLVLGTYFGNYLNDLDYISVMGGVGFSDLKNWSQRNARRLVIAIKRPGKGSGLEVQEKTYDKPPALSEFGHVVELPKSMADVIISNDRVRAESLRSLVSSE